MRIRFAAKLVVFDLDIACPSHQNAAVVANGDADAFVGAASRAVGEASVLPDRFAVVLHGDFHDVCGVLGHIGG